MCDLHLVQRLWWPPHIGIEIINHNYAWKTSASSISKFPCNESCQAANKTEEMEQHYKLVDGSALKQELNNLSLSLSLSCGL